MKLKAFFNIFKGFSVFRICICATGKFFVSHYAAQRLGPKSRLVSKIQLSLSVWFELGTFRFWVTHHDTVLHYPNRHVTFPVFPRILVFWILFARKWILVKTRRKLLGGGGGGGGGRGKGWGWRMGRRIIGLNKRGIYTSSITLVTTVENILCTFVLLNGGVPDVETIYFVSIEQKKDKYLQKLPGVLVIRKDSANK